MMMMIMMMMMMMVVMMMMMMKYNYAIDSVFRVIKLLFSAFEI